MLEEYIYVERNIYVPIKKKKGSPLNLWNTLTGESFVRFILYPLWNHETFTQLVVLYR